MSLKAWSLSFVNKVHLTKDEQEVRQVPFTLEARIRRIKETEEKLLLISKKIFLIKGFVQTVKLYCEISFVRPRLLRISRVLRFINLVP